MAIEEIGESTDITGKDDAKTFIKDQLNVAFLDDKLIRIELTKTGIHTYEGTVFTKV
jgi:hypothetical protein